MALVMFFLVERNSSSFSAILLSISCLTWVSSSWHLSTLFSSCSRVASASDRAASSSIFSASILLQILSISWMERPPSLIWSMMSLISLERVLFSLRTSSSWSMVSSYADLILKRSEEALRVSFWLTSRSKERRSTLPFHSPMTLSNCLAFLSMAALRTWAWSRLLAMSLLSEAILALAFSTWFSLAFRLSVAASASVSLAVSFILVISSSSPLATASVSYFWRQHCASPSALAVRRRTFSRPAASSSRASRAPSSSCSKLRYFPRSRPLSRASLSQRALTSLSWAASADFCLARMFRLLSRSPTMRRRSEFSTAILFLEAAKSPRVRLALSTFLLMALRASNMVLLDLSEEAWALMTSSVAARASAISFMIWPLSFSILLFIFPRASICSDISAMASPCFLFRFPRMDSCWMLASSTSLRSLFTSASLFLFSSTWAVVAPLASSG